MRIVIHDCACHPFQLQLARSLAARGHDVLVLYGAEFQSPRGPLSGRPTDARLSIEGVTIGEPIQKYDFFKRFLQERKYGKKAAAAAAAFRPDAVLSSNTFLEAQRDLLRMARHEGATFHFWLQDIIGIGASRILGAKYGVAGRVIASRFARLERRLLQESDSVIAISEDFRPLLRELRVAEHRVNVIENWQPLDDITPRPRDNGWARTHGLVGRFVFLYSGTLGLKHDPELLVELARSFKDRPDVSVVVVSEGIGADHLRQRKAELALDTLVLLPFQAFDALPESLGSGDVLVAILEPDAGVFSVPSKVLTYLCAGRPVLVSVPPENLAARTVRQAAAGKVVAPSDRMGFVGAAQALERDRETAARMGKAGRAYAEKAFDIAAIADRFENILATRALAENSDLKGFKKGTRVWTRGRS